MSSQERHATFSKPVSQTFSLLIQMIRSGKNMHSLKMCDTAERLGIGFLKTTYWS